MNRIASVFIATSLDGYIARDNGDIDWLNEANQVVPEGEDCGFFVFMEAVDVLVMGRNTFEKVLSFGQWPYGDKPVIVLSSNRIEIPDNLPETVSWSSESPAELTDRLVSEGVARIYVDGGVTIQRFLEAGLIKDITITSIPVILGNGIPLFSNVSSDISLKHMETNAYDFGFVQSTYVVEEQMPPS